MTSQERSKRVLVLAYYFPPMGLSGVQRAAKLVKYLPASGWIPHVLTTQPGGYFAHDESLLREVEDAEITRSYSLDPTRLFGSGATVSLPSEGRRGFLSAVSQSVFLPDNKIGWAPFALREARRLHRAWPFDAVFSTAPPYTSHLVGARLARAWGVPLVTDFRDDWLGNPRHVYPTALHRRAHATLERRALRASSLALTINPVIQRRLKQSAGNTPVCVLPQGFDPADFEPGAKPSAETFSLAYTGVFYDAQRPDEFLEACAAFLKARPEARSAFRLDFAGLLSDAARAQIEARGLAGLTTYRGYLPHREATALMQRSTALWLTIGRRSGAESISTGKLYDYVGARRPILALVPPGAAQSELNGHGAAFIAAPDDVPAIAARVAELYERWESATLPEPDLAFVARFDRRKIAADVGAHLDGLTALSKDARSK